MSTAHHTASSCHDMAPLLEQRWDGEQLMDADARLVDEHLASCIACQTQDRAMTMLLEQAGELGRQTYPRPVTIAPLQLRPQRTAPLRWALALGAATGMVALGVVVGMGLGNHSAPELASEPGQVLVRLVVPAPAAHSVEVAGDFTGWDRRMPLKPIGDGLWAGELRVQAGRYRYVVVINGDQMLPDPAARQVVDDGFGGKSSVLDVGDSI